MSYSEFSSNQWKHENLLESSPDKKRNRSLRCCGRVLLLSPEHNLWIIKNLGVSIDHQTISLGAKGILEYIQKYLIPPCLQSPDSASLWLKKLERIEFLNPAPLNISTAAAPVKAPLKHKSQTCTPLHNRWNNKVFIGRNITSTYRRGDNSGTAQCL